MRRKAYRGQPPKRGDRQAASGPTRPLPPFAPIRRCCAYSNSHSRRAKMCDFTACSAGICTAPSASSDYVFCARLLTVDSIRHPQPKPRMPCVVGSCLSGNCPKSRCPSRTYLQRPTGYGARLAANSTLPVGSSQCRSPSEAHALKPFSHGRIWTSAFARYGIPMPNYL